MAIPTASFQTSLRRFTQLTWSMAWKNGALEDNSKLNFSKVKFNSFFLSGDLTQLGSFLEHIAVRSRSISFKMRSCSSFLRFGDRHAALAICLYVALTSILPRDSNCSGTFHSILFDGHSILTLTEVDEGLLLAVDSTHFLGVDESSGEKDPERLATCTDSSFATEDEL